MLNRMLRYFTDIQAITNLPIKQYCLYIGKNKPKFQTKLEDENITYRYNFIDIKSIDCELLLKEDTPEALVLAILCDFKQKKPKKVVQYIIEKLQEHTKDDIRIYNDYLLMLETLSTNRELKETVKEIEMLRETRYQDLPSYEIGIEKGLEKGLEKGKNEAKKASAKEMKKLGFDLEIISKVTKLSIKEIKSL